MKHNQDPYILHVNKQTLTSLFVNGLIQQDGGNNSMTAVQNSGSPSLDESKWARPDLYIRNVNTAIWLESKLDKHTRIQENHFNIPSWLKWDQDWLFSPLARYFEYDIQPINDSYGDRYIMTLAFKKIHVHQETHLKRAEEMRAFVADKPERDWFYSVEFFGNEFNNKTHGLEVSGTFKKMN